MIKFDLISFNTLLFQSFDRLCVVNITIFSDFPLLTKKILELRTEHLKLMVEGMSLTTVFPIEADLDQKTFEYGKDTISNLEALDGAKTEEIETKDPLASALEASSLIDLN